MRPAVIPGPSTSVARETRPPGRSSQIPTSAAPVATRTRWHASSSAESMPLGKDAISARSASRSTPAAESLSVRSGMSLIAPQRAGRHARLGDRRGGVRRRRRQEPLQVDEPVAAVAAIVDPVVAQPAGLAPRPDRVRVHAQHVRRLRHRQRGIARAGSPGAGWPECGIWQASLGSEPFQWWRIGALTFHHFTRVANRPMYPSIGSCHLPGPFDHPLAGRFRSARRAAPATTRSRVFTAPTRALSPPRPAVSAPSGPLPVVTARGQPHVRERCADAQDRDRDDDEDRRQADRPRAPVPARSCAGRRPRRLVGTGVAASTARGSASAVTTAPTTTSHDPGRHAARSGHRIDDPPGAQRSAPTGRRHQDGDRARRPPVALGQQPHRLRAIERGHDQRPPQAGAQHGPPASSRTGMPHATAWSMLLSCSMRSRTGVSRREVGRHVVGDVRGGALRLARRRRRGRRRGRRRRSPIWSSPSTIWNGTARRVVLDGGPRLARAGLEPGPAEHERARGARPRTPPRRRSGRRPRRSGPGRPGRSRAPARPARPASPRGSVRPGRCSRSSGAGSTRSRAARGRPGRGPRGARRDDSGRRPATRSALPARGINSPKEPTRRVGVDVIAAVSIARPLRAAIHATGRP